MRLYNVQVWSSDRGRHPKSCAQIWIDFGAWLGYDQGWIQTLLLVIWIKIQIPGWQNSLSSDFRWVLLWALLMLYAESDRFFTFTHANTSGEHQLWSEILEIIFSISRRHQMFLDLLSSLEEISFFLCKYHFCFPLTTRPHAALEVFHTWSSAGVCTREPTRLNPGLEMQSYVFTHTSGSKPDTACITIHAWKGRSKWKISVQSNADFFGACLDPLLSDGV